jgi:Ser/Thr protein kinase RdoA (MazF antagonist)
MKSAFPASYSTLSPLSLADLVSERYVMTDVQCRFLSRGVGDTYVIENTGGTFILKIYRSSHRTLRQVNMEMELLFVLQRAEVPVAYPIRDRSGNVVQVIDAIEGERYAVLFIYAPGTSVRILNEEQLRVFGYQMARFHDVSSTLQLGSGRWTFDSETTLFTPLRLLKNYFDEIPDEYSWLQQAAGQVVNRLERADKTMFSGGYCHFDFLPKNFHFDKNNKITFFDFDFMGHGWLINDIMSYWQYLQFDVYAGRMTRETADNLYSVFISAYRRQRLLNEEELHIIPYLTLCFWLFYMGFHTTHDQFFPFLQPSMLKIYTGFLQSLAQQYWNS